MRRLTRGSDNAKIASRAAEKKTRAAERLPINRADDFETF
jgi:hypothetical protein